MNKTKFNSDIYVVGWGKDYPLKPAKPEDGKGIHAISWRTTDIKAQMAHSAHLYTVLFYIVLLIAIAKEMLL